MRTFEDLPSALIKHLFAPYHLNVEITAEDQDIPGSYWGNPEAGLIADKLYVRSDTPIHSLLHEGCHYICMDDARRAVLHTDAGGEFEEENAVCYLQILLADQITGYSANQCMADMDEWGYTFRLGSTRLWFEQDADDAQAFLKAKNLFPGTQAIPGSD